MTLTFQHPPAYLLLIMILAAAAAWWLYRYTERTLSRRLRLLLSAIRFLIFTAIGALLLNPLLNALSKVSYAPIIAVLHDASESIMIQKDSTFVKDAYPEKLQNFLGSFEPSAYTLDFYGYANELQGDYQADSLAFEETGTNISQALSQVRKRYQNQNLGAVVLIGDGIATAGANPLYEVEGMKLPVYTVLLGDTTAQQDISIKEVLFNEIAYLENEMPIKVKVQNIGYKNAALKVSLSNNQKVLQTQTLTLSDKQREGEVDFLILPQAVGLQQYQISVSRQPEEISYRNNRRLIFVNVLENRAKIALFAGRPHPDLGMFSNAFEQSDRYELSSFVLKSPGTFYENPLDYNWEEFDLFILHNYPQSNADRAMLDRIISSLEEDKKPLMTFVGVSTQLNLLKRLEPYMALNATNLNRRAEEVIANFLPAYRQHSSYTFSDRWLSWANASPPIFRNRSEWQARTTAEVYATAKIKNVELDYPVYALQNQLGRKNMTFIGENIWRMRAHSYVENESFEAFDTWLFNNIKWLMVSDDKRKFKVSPSKRIFTGNEPVLIRGQVYDDSYNPIPEVEIKLLLTSPNNTEETYYFNETSEGQYFLERNNLEEGTYSYRAEGRKDGKLLGKDQGQFSVGKSNVEHFNLQANQGLMQQLALRTGGKSTSAQEIEALAAEIKNNPNLLPETEFKKQRSSFHQYNWMLLLLLLLLSVEWTLRKLNSLL